MYDSFEDIKQDMTEEEIDEMIDGIIIPLAEQCHEEDNVDAVLNVERAKLLIGGYNTLKHLTKGTKVKVTYEMNEPYRSMGSVSITGKNITFKRPEAFVAAVKLASNFNVYPKTNGTIVMDLTFHGLTTPIE